MMRRRIAFITKSAIIAAVYIALTAIFAAISFGPIQFRISEVLTVLPALTPAAIPGLFIGCALSNLIFGGLGPVDLVLGSTATLLAATASYFLRKRIWLVPLPPVLLNGLIVGAYLPYLLPDANLMLIPSMLTVAAGELLVCYGIGYPLLAYLKLRWPKIMQKQ